MQRSTPVAAALTLSPDNPCNTTVYDADLKALYTVDTEHGKATVTRVKNADGEILASLEWRDMLPDRVTLGKKAPTSIRDWLHTSLVPFKESVLCFSYPACIKTDRISSDVDWKDNSGRKYKWRGNAPGRQLEVGHVSC